MRVTYILSLVLSVRPIASQQIWDVVSCLVCVFAACNLKFLQWQTTWDRSKLLTRMPLSSPINFVTPGPIGSANIDVLDTQRFQNIDGFGSTLSRY
jgi:hypothetical protein